MAMIIVPRRVPWRRGAGQLHVDWSHPINRGLVSWWDHSIATDPVRDAASQIDLSMTNLTVGNYSQRYGYDFLNYNGSDSRLSINDARLRTTRYTVSVQLVSDLNSVSTEERAVITNYENFLFMWSHTNAAFQQAWSYKGGATWYNAKYTTALVKDTHYHCVGTYDGANLRAYLQGEVETTTPTTADPNIDDQPLLVGCVSALTQFFDGLIGNIRMWHRALTDDEVRDLYINPDIGSRPRTQRIFIPVNGTKTATLILDDKDSNIVANATGIRWAWFDQMPGSSMAAPTDKGAVETTDGSGSLSVDIPNSTLASGQTGYLSISNSDGTIATNHLQGGGPAKVD